MKKGLGIGLSLVLLAGMFFFLDPQIQLAHVTGLLQATDPWAIVAAVVSLWLNFAISTERYRLIVRNMLVRAPSFGPLYRLTFCSVFIAHLVAVGPAADVVRVGYGRFRFDMPMVVAIESVLYDRVLALVGIATFGLVLLPLQIAHGIPAVVWIPQAILWFVSLLGISLVTWGARASVMQRIPSLGSIARSVKRFLPTAFGQGGLPLQILLAIGYSISYGLVIWLLARGMTLNLGMLEVLQFAPLILLVQSLPLFYVGWGARETVIVGTLGLSGVLSSDQALAVSIATGAVFFVASTPGAIVWLSLAPKASD
jgi:hypothetical protein